jgi:DeoR/GlpR family transcriptional regulator of sugar metabolism
MLQAVRKEKIISLLKKNKEYEIVELRKYLNVSLATIHRDLNELEREGRVKKVHGGVLISDTYKVESRNIIRLRTNVELKRNIAIKALELVDNGDCLFLDNSTTCYYFAKELSKSNFEGLLIVTNSCLIPGLFLKNENIKIVSTGGLLEKEFSCFVGQRAIATINEFNSNKFFMSIGAISLKGELSDDYRPNLNEIKREMYKRSKEHICMVDSTKFNHIGQSKVFLVSEIDKVITDSGCDSKTRKEFSEVVNEFIIA